MNQVLCGARIQTLIFLSPAPTTVHVGAEHTLRPTQDPSQKQLKSPVFPQNSSFAFFITCSVKAKWMKINEGLSGTKIQECASTNFSGHRDMSVIQVEVKGKGTAFFQRERLLSQMHSFIGQINMSSAAPPPICPCSTGTEVKDGLSPTLMELQFYISDIRTFDPKPEWTVGSFHDQEVHGHYGSRGPVERNFQLMITLDQGPEALDIP